VSISLEDEANLKLNQFVGSFFQKKNLNLVLILLTVSFEISFSST
jgi:hypothetical protein